MKLHDLFPEISLNPASAKDIKQWILQLAVEGKLTKKWREENVISKDDWQEKKLSEIAEINGGYAFKSQHYTENGIRVIRISDFDEQGLKNEKIVRHPYNITFEAYRLKPNNIIMAMTGGTVGKALLIQEVLEDMFVNQRVANIKITDSSLPNFVFSVLKAKDVQSVIEEAKNSTNDNISMNDIKNFKIPIPPLEEQQAIVTIVEDLFKEVDALAQQATERIGLKRSYAQAALKRLCEADTAKEWQQIVSVFPEIFNDKQTIKTLRETILQLAVQGKLTAKWRSSSASLPTYQTAHELLAQIKAEKTQLIKDKKIKAEKPLPAIEADEIPFELPEGWVWCRLGEVILYSDAGKSPDCEKRPAQKNEWGVLTTTSIQQNKFVEEANKVLPTNFVINPNQQVELGDILITRAGPINRTGVACKVDKLNSKLILSDKTIRLKYIKDSIFPDYVVLTLNSDSIRRLLLDKMIGMASSQVNISQENIKGICFPFPTFNEQQIIVEKVNAMMGLCDKLEREVEGLNKKEDLLKLVLGAGLEVKKIKH